MDILNWIWPKKPKPPQEQPKKRPIIAAAHVQGRALPPPAAVLQTPVPPSAPSPPNWAQSLGVASTQLDSPFIELPVSVNSAEYREIEKLFVTCDADQGQSYETMTSLKRIVNPELWNRFIRTRADLLCSKSEDLDLLSASAELGLLTDDQFAHKTHVALNFDKSHLGGSPYSDNVVLLFHACRRGPGAIDRILREGFDERLALDGVYGPGIYMTDNPWLAQYYDYEETGQLIVSAVTLGDCVVVEDLVEVHSNSWQVREPKKLPTERRTPFDLFFDSIMARAAVSANEYVIFNRALCCPLYVASYVTHPSLTTARTSWTPDRRRDLIDARVQLPSFAWTIPDSNANTIQATANVKSPFYASTVFQAMTKDQFQDLTDDDEWTGTETETLALKHLQLARLGFENVTENSWLLRLYDFDMKLTLKSLLEKAAEEESRSCRKCSRAIIITD